MLRRNPPSSLLFGSLLCPSSSSSSSTRIPISNLKPPKTGIPQEFEHELSGTPNLEWLSNLPQFSEVLEQSTKLPDANEFWQSPTHSALEQVASAQCYFEILKIISEHGFFFLIPKAILARDAPLPHIAYEDIMKSLLTCSMQRPPEEQFQLPANVLRLLLCTAAHYILQDRGYFQKVESWFRQNIERQQSLGSEAWSAWVMCCVAANRIDSALMFLRHMEENKISFDPVVFNFMLHPSEIMQNEKGVPDSVFNQHIAKGFLGQQRLLRVMQVDDGTFATGVHAMFVYYAITRQPVQQWEVIRVAVQTHRSRLSDRTVKMILNVFKHEKGRRCGPMTVRALVKMFAVRKDMFNTCLILATARQREAARIQKLEQQQRQQRQQQLEGTKKPKKEEVMIPVLKFNAEEERFIMRCFDDGETKNYNATEQQGSYASVSPKQQRDAEKHLPLLKKLISGDKKPLSPMMSNQQQQLTNQTTSIDDSASSSAALFTSVEDEEDIDLMTQLIFSSSTLSKTKSGARNSPVDISSLVQKLDAAAAKRERSKSPNFHSPSAKERAALEKTIPTRYTSPREVQEIGAATSLISNAIDGDAQASSAMSHFSEEHRKSVREERALDEKSKKAWMNPTME